MSSPHRSLELRPFLRAADTCLGPAEPLYVGHLGDRSLVFKLTLAVHIRRIGTLGRPTPFPGIDEDRPGPEDDVPTYAARSDGRKLVLAWL